MASFALSILASIGGFASDAASRWSRGFTFAVIAVAAIAAWWGYAAVFGGPSRVEIAAARRQAGAEVVAAVERENTAKVLAAVERAREGEQAAAAERDRADAASRSADEAWSRVRELLNPTRDTVCFSPEAVEGLRKW